MKALFGSEELEGPVPVRAAGWEPRPGEMSALRVLTPCTRRSLSLHMSTEAPGNMNFPLLLHPLIVSASLLLLI